MRSYTGWRPVDDGDDINRILDARSQTVIPTKPHGRNAETWEKKGISASERFNWYYSDDELQEWVTRVQQLSR